MEAGMKAAAAEGKEETADSETEETVELECDGAGAETVLRSVPTTV